ncbi:MAG: ParA family protein [Hyphomicrobiaceae bacterium]
MAFISIGFLGGRFFQKIMDPLPAKLDADLKASKKKLENLAENSQSELQNSKTQTQNARKQIRELKGRLTRYENIRERLLSDEIDLWGVAPPEPPQGFQDRLKNSRTKIIAIANLKGGVGKTTLASNLIAYMEQEAKKRVLAIDLDYQGSLSSALIQAAGLDFSGSTVDDFLSGARCGEDIPLVAKSLNPAMPDASILTSAYQLAQLENKLMLRWLLGEVDGDIRYNLGQALVSDEVQNAFDIVIIDCPPRLTTAGINAICAAHQLIVPTVPDSMSSEAVGRFANQIKSLKGNLNPELKFAGVVLNLAQQRDLKPHEEAAVSAIRQDLLRQGLEPHIFKRHIPRTASVAGVAGTDVAYLRNANFRTGVMKQLGDEVAARVWFEEAA